MSTYTADKAMLDAFVKGCAEYQKNSARLDALNDERGALITANGELRKSIVPVFKALSAHSWADRKSTRLNSSHSQQSRMPSSA